jgi:hypothetical protein
MDVVRKTNTVKMAGSLEVKDQITVADITVSGNLIVNGKQIGVDDGAPTNEVFIGNPDVDGSWKLELVNNELVFSQRDQGQWTVKQTMS